RYRLEHRAAVRAVACSHPVKATARLSEALQRQKEAADELGTAQRLGDGAAKLRAQRELAQARADLKKAHDAPKRFLSRLVTGTASGQVRLFDLDAVDQARRAEDAAGAQLAQAQVREKQAAARLRAARAPADKKAASAEVARARADAAAARGKLDRAL